MGIIAWIVLGALAGFIANLIMGGGDGLIMMIILGIVGAVVGGFIAGSVLGIADVTGFNLHEPRRRRVRRHRRDLRRAAVHGPQLEADRLMADQHVKVAVGAGRVR